MRKLTTLLLLCALLWVPAASNPAHPGSVLLPQPDGTMLSVCLVGDEFYHFNTTADGYTIVVNDAGAYVYAKRDGLSLEPTSLLAHDAGSRSAAELDFLANVPKRLVDETAVAQGHVRRARRAVDLSNFDFENFRGLVILLDFTNKKFASEDPQSFYSAMFSSSGFTGYHDPITDRDVTCPGSVRDYFNDQSQGAFAPPFDVYGPYPATYVQNGVAMQARSNQCNSYSQLIFNNALKQADGDVDYSRYDNNHDGKIDMVYFLVAGYSSSYSGNNRGYLWPHASNLNWTGSSYDGKRIDRYASSTELYGFESSPNTVTVEGIGTVAHEFSHVLGLPDFYPTSGDEYSVLDEWDLMDGGNFSDAGWCPPNLSAHERESLGWYSPEDLTAAVAVQSMPSYDSSRRAYRIVNDASPSEYYLLENRQWERWDQMLPGHGLLITHVDFDSYVWEGNRVNNSPSHHRLEYFNADGMDVNAYIDYYGDNGARYSAEGRNLRLQHTAYPYVDADGVSHDALTDTSSPAATLFNRNAQGVQFMGKPITNIRETDGLISFDFMGGATDAITHHPSPNIQSPSPIIHDLQGRQVSGSLKPGLYIKNGKKVIIY